MKAVKVFAETRARELNEREEDTGPSARKKSGSSGGETLAYLKEKIEKKNKVKRKKARTEKPKRTLE